MNKEKLKLWLKENSFDKNGKIFTQKIKDKGKIDEIIKFTSFLDVKENASLVERIYCLLNNFTEIPKCKICKVNYSKFKGFSIGYGDFCNINCQIKFWNSKWSYNKKGCKHSLEHIEKCKHIGRKQSDEEIEKRKNSTRWYYKSDKIAINNGIINTVILVHDYDKYKEQGWEIGKLPASEYFKDCLRIGRRKSLETHCSGNSYNIKSIEWFVWINKIFYLNGIHAETNIMKGNKSSEKKYFRICCRFLRWRK